MASEEGLVLLRSYLELTPAQQREIARIESSYEQQRPKLRQDVWDARDELAAVLRDPEVDESKAIAALRKLSRSREEMAVNTIKYLFEVRDHLTPRQREKLADVADCGMCGPTGGPGMGRDRGGGGCGLGRCDGP